MTEPLVICERCGNENAGGRRFCDGCGAALIAPCGACGAQNRFGARFCGDCGAPLGDTPARSESAAEARPRIEGGGARAAPLGPAERRLVSILFADLVGFTPFAEERDPEEVRETLDRYFGLARSIVDRYGGSIEKFIGDAVMAVWGTPVAHEDDAERAVRAALDLVTAVPQLGSSLAARAGVMTGEAAVDREARGEAMVAGDLVNTAARLQGAATPATVLVGETTMRAATGAIAFEAAGDLNLKGKALPVVAWRALRVVAQRRGAGRATGLEPPFVGRDEELRLLKELLHHTGRDRRSRLLSITGPAGIGKSRLAWELEKYVDGIVERVWWHYGRSPAYGDGIAFWALGEMVRGRVGLAEGDDETTTRAKLAATLELHVLDPDERRRLEPALLALLGLEAPPPGGREVLFEAWRTFFERIAATGTTVLIFEDLQWADPGLVDFVEHLHEWSRGVPLLIVTLARPELFDRRPTWGAGTRNFSAIALEPIDRAAMHELMAGLVPGLPAAAADAIVSRAEGVPLYAVEFVRSLLADGRLVPDGSSHRPTGDLTDLAVPESLRSLVAARLDALEPADRTLLQDASVLGRSFTPAALAAIQSSETPDLVPRLQVLVRRELLILDLDPRSPERGQYAFVQALIREVAYDTLARRERRARHLAAARHFESLGGNELADALAEHYLAAHAASGAGDESAAIAAQARIALGAAADRALALGSPDQAGVRLEQAIAITPDGLARFDLLDRAADAAIAAGRYDRAEEHARAAVAGRDSVSDRVAAAQSTNRLATAIIEGGQLPAALAVVEEAIRRLPAGDGPAAEAALRATLARCLYRQSRNEQAIEEGRRAVALAEKLEDRALIAEAMASMAAGFVQLGQPNVGIALLRQAVELADAAGRLRLALRSRSNLAVAQRAIDQAPAIPAFRDVLALARRVGDRNLVSWGSAHLADLLIGTALDWDEALGIATNASEEATAAADRVLLAQAPIIIAAYRGEPISVALRAFDDLVEPLGDPFPRSLNGMAHVIAAFAAGDAIATEAAALAMIERQDALSGVATLFGLWAAGVRHDRAAIQRMVAAAPDHEWFSPKLQTGAEALIAAIVAYMDGRPNDATAGFVAAIESFNALSDFLTAADLGLMFVELVPDSPQARVASEASRDVYAKVGAIPLLARIETALPLRPAGPAAGAPAVAGEVI